MKVEYSREAPVAAADLWRVVTHFERYPVVLGSVAETKRLEGEEFGEGVRWQESRRALGRVSPGEVLVVEAREGEFLRLRYNFDGSEFDMAYEFDETPSGTLFTISTEADNDLGQGFMGFVRRIAEGVGPKLLKDFLKRDHHDFVEAARPVT